MQERYVLIAPEDFEHFVPETIFVANLDRTPLVNGPGMLYFLSTLPCIPFSGTRSDRRQNLGADAPGGAHVGKLDTTEDFF